MDEPALHQRDVTRSRFGDNARINMGDVHYHLPHRSTRSAVRVIPYPRNEDLVHRPDLIDRLDTLLPQTSGSHSAALWGLGGSGKTQITLDYAYRRCEADNECCVFWVHADSEATFLADYKTIGKKLGVDERLDRSDLLDAVRSAIEARPKWLMIFDNADDLRLFGVDEQAREGKASDNLYKFVPHASTGTTLWTSRDAQIAGTLVGPRRGIEVQSMAMNEAALLLANNRDGPSTTHEALREAGFDTLLQELQCLPLAISQAGAYMRRMSMTAQQYLGLLRQGKTRWQVLKVGGTDRHRRPEVSNSVLETWRISIERIRVESEMSYRILHVIAYVDNQDISQELVMAAAADRCDTDDGDFTRQASELEVLGAITRLKEFSFLSLRQIDDGGRRYEMHKLVQEAIRYGVRVRDSVMTKGGKASDVDTGPQEDEVFYCSRALQIVDDLFPPPEPALWARCEQYLRHAIQVGDWAEVSAAETAAASLLARVSQFLNEGGRWREKEPIDGRAWGLRREVLGDEHPDTISSMASLAATYHEQGRYGKAEIMRAKVLELRQEVLGEKHQDTAESMSDLADTYHEQGRYFDAEKIKNKALRLQREVLGETDPDTIRSMADLAETYRAQGRYKEAQESIVRALELRREVLGEKHPDTIRSMAELAAAFHDYGQYNEAQGFVVKALELRREVLGEKHPDTIRSMANLGAIYHAQRRYKESNRLQGKAINLLREVLGEKHPDTIRSIANLAVTYHDQGRYKEAQESIVRALELRREVLGEKHPDTIRSMADLATMYHAQGRYDEAEKLKDKALELRREVLGEKHPDTIRSMADLAVTYYEKGWYGKAEGIHQEALDFRREVLGEKHPDTIWSMAELATAYHQQGRYDEDEEISAKVLELRREVLGEKHPDTIRSMASLAATYHAQGRYDEALQLHQTALDLRRHILGEKHPDTMQSVAYLASMQDSLKPWYRSLWEAMRRKTSNLHNSKSSYRQGT
ncbi:hypothetical protein FOCG_17619 [Fusarium oxysporum f. sp. radicis-lycopersici 26381]|nr:hypothetical protein FOCG_17619 [Fusarium oxysporum f. sp. radicis-lycopersici 26381]